MKPDMKMMMMMTVVMKKKPKNKRYRGVREEERKVK